MILFLSWTLEFPETEKKHRQAHTQKQLQVLRPHPRKSVHGAVQLISR